MAIRGATVALLGILIAACGGSEEVVAGDGSAAGLELVGTSWQVVDGVSAVVGYPLTITFAADNTGGHDGCNGWGTFETPSNGQFWREVLTDSHVTGWIDDRHLTSWSAAD